MTPLAVLLLALGAIITGLVLWKVSMWQVRAFIMAGAVFIALLFFTAEMVWITQEGQLTERYVLAIDQLGSKQELAVRLGGIYALERIARDSKNTHWPIMEVLTAYIRERALWKKDQQPTGEQQPAKLAPDIQAVLTVLGRRVRKYKDGEEQRLYLVGVNIRRANLNGAHLEGAVLSEARLEGAVLSGAHLEGAVLRETHLEGAVLAGANLEEAYLAKAHLEGANLSGALLEGAILSGARLEGAVLTDAAGLTLEQIESAVTDENTRFPKCFRPPPYAESKSE